MNQLLICTPFMGDKSQRTSYAQDDVSTVPVMCGFLCVLSVWLCHELIFPCFLLGHREWENHQFNRLYFLFLKTQYRLSHISVKFRLHCLQILDTTLNPHPSLQATADGLEKAGAKCFSGCQAFLQPWKLLCFDWTFYRLCSNFHSNRFRTEGFPWLLLNALMYSKCHFKLL